MKTDTKIPGLIETMVVFFAAYLIVSAAASFFFGIMGYTNPKEIETILFQSQVFLFVSQVFIFMVLVLYFKNKLFNLKSIFLIRSVSKTTVIQSIIFAVALLPVMDELDRLVQMIFQFDEIPDSLFASFQFSNISEFLLIVMTIVVLGPIFEEFYFRGVLLLSARNRFGIINAIIFSSLFWTGIHAILNWTLQIFLLGLILAALTWQYRSTIPSIIVHAINNLFSLIMMNLANDQLSGFYEWHGHVHYIWLIPSIIILYISGKKLFAPAKSSS